MPVWALTLRTVPAVPRLLTAPLRVALFTDSFFEANGVATLSREFAAFAARRQYPFFGVHAGPRTQAVHGANSTTVQLKRGLASFRLDYDLSCDPLLNRYRNWVLRQIRPFRPDLVHITGPGDLGVLGFWIAHLLQVPLVASWHTNLHEYAGRRVDRKVGWLPDHWRRRIASTAEAQSLRACMWFYGYGRFTLAPNAASVDMLGARTGRPSFLMAHGVDTERYAPSRRQTRDGPFRIGYVGRLTPEKNVRLLVQLEQSLLAAGERNFRLVLIGEGSEKEWLGRQLKFGELPGILTGDALAQAFADMDVFVFPSRTDTFGLVLLEAMASGVPVVVSHATGARVEIEDGITGFHAEDLEGFTARVLQLMNGPVLQQKMGIAARRFACSKSWDTVFDQMYRTYDAGLAQIGARQLAAAADTP